MNPLSDQQIIRSWEQNVSPWIKAISNDEISSRIETTNKAIITQIIKQSPKSVLDIGCGEGWLVNTLEEKGIKAMGIDAIPEFIEYANKNQNGRYEKISYEEISNSLLKEKFDLIVCNFSLLGKESTELVFKQIPRLLTSNGNFLVQTIHPCFNNSLEHYIEGWRSGSWKGFNDEFKDPAPWYFRTLDSWVKLFTNNGLSLKQIYEPYDKTYHQAASIIFYAELTS